MSAGRRRRVESRGRLPAHCAERDGAAVCAANACRVIVLCYFIRRQRAVLLLLLQLL